MNLFIDTSALVKYYYPEAESDQVERVILHAEKVYVCELTSVELASALAKKVRAGEMSAEDLRLVWNSFARDLKAAHVEIVGLFEEDYLEAAKLILKLGLKNNLRTLDSLQLAAALKVRDASFISYDKALSGIAGELGMRIAKP